VPADDRLTILLEQFDAAWEMLGARLCDAPPFRGEDMRIYTLSDEEYFWEPVPGCWSLRQIRDGRWLLDGEGGGGPAPDPAPVTTIVWRLGHIGGTLGGFARMRFGDGKPLTNAELTIPAHAGDIQSFLTDNYRYWMDGLLALPEASWFRPLGAAFGSYAEANTLDLALHVLDELVHHAAEVGVLRDLWAAGLRNPAR
jgi:hypothetical protein